MHPVVKFALACSLLLLSSCYQMTLVPQIRLAEWQYAVSVRIVVVCPDGTGGVGSGVAVGPARVLTAYHVAAVCDGAQYAVLGYDGKTRPALFHEGDQSADSATLVTGGDKFELYATPSARKLLIDDYVCSVGGDDEIPFLKKCGTVFQLSKDGFLVYTTIPTVRGNSGGPVFHGKELVGIVVAARTHPDHERINKSMGVPSWIHLVPGGQ
jgi:S1-C subfamily serine protease